MDLSGKRVTVMGLGRFGGGLGAARWLAGQGADVLVTDLEPAERLADSVQGLRDLVDRGTVRLRLGEHNVSDFTACDLVVASPAVPRPWDNRYLRAAKAAGVAITTEIELLARRLPERGRTIGVTGSAGKSTTAALIAHILGECGERVFLGGNIGGSLLGEDVSGAWVVLELSSFQLHWLGWWSPRVAVVTNIAENHLDWHGSMEHYRSSKRRLLEWQEPGDTAVLGDPSVAEWPVRAGVRRLVIGDESRIEGLMIPGRHNQGNAACAVAAVMAMGIPGIEFGRAAAAARTFAGLPHRLQLVHTARGVRFYNDSKSTTPKATALALVALGVDGQQGPSPVHLIAGGCDKGSDLRGIGGQARFLAGLYTIGATGERIAQAGESALGRDAADDSVFRCGTLDRALARAWERAGEGDVILLSPGCASWDQFANYEERGERFVALARALK
jgi:UDP-N-acetylmuramoylalanine--D-glutamate ligase